MKPSGDNIPQSGGAAGSAGCAWIISPPGWPYCECGLKPTHRDPQTGETLCSHHAEDYAEAFGWESLRTIDDNPPDGASNPSAEVPK